MKNCAIESIEEQVDDINDSALSVTTDAALKVIDRVLGKANNAPTVHTLNLASELPFKTPSGVMGAYHHPRRNAYLIVSELHSAFHTEFILRHEVFGHAGLRSFFGKKLGKILLSIEADMKEVSSSARIWRVNNQSFYKNTLSRKKFFLRSIEEALADMAGDKIECQSFDKYRSESQNETRSYWLLPSLNVYHAKVNWRGLSTLKKARKHILYGKRSSNRSDLTKTESKKCPFFEKTLQSQAKPNH